LGEVVDTSILKTGRFPRYPRSLPWDIAQAKPHRATIAKRFSGVLGMFSSLEVKVLYPT
jgi:hypothetical protein